MEEIKRFVVYLPTNDYTLLSAILRSKRSNVSEFFRGVAKSYLSKNLRGKNEAEARILSGRIERPYSLQKNTKAPQTELRDRYGLSVNGRSA